MLLLSLLLELSGKLCSNFGDLSVVFGSFLLSFHSLHQLLHFKDLIRYNLFRRLSFLFTCFPLFVFWGKVLPIPWFLVYYGLIFRHHSCFLCRWLLGVSTTPIDFSNSWSLMSMTTDRLAAIRLEYHVFTQAVYGLTPEEFLS